MRLFKIIQNNQTSEQKKVLVFMSNRGEQYMNTYKQ